MIYDYKVQTSKGTELSLFDFRGKVILIINTATGCSFTPQYAPIEQMYRDYHEKGLKILNIPCNQVLYIQIQCLGI
ncbi:MAG: redoxin domain-containing protein [Clostridia bacterium]|nr:redoxin domain-containing protein [Clostridia bacterium]